MILFLDLQNQIIRVIFFDITRKMIHYLSYDNNKKNRASELCMRFFGWCMLCDRGVCWCGSGVSWIEPWNTYYSAAAWHIVFCIIAFI